VTTSVLPGWADFTWGMCLIVGGALGIASAWWQDRLTGLLVERVALLAIAGSAPLYGIMLLALAGPIGITPAAMTISAGIAAGWRVHHVNRQLKTLSRWIDETF
jgi:hypothetical protein